MNHTSLNKRKSIDVFMSRVRRKLAPACKLEGTANIVQEQSGQFGKATCAALRVLRMSMHRDHRENVHARRLPG